MVPRGQISRELQEFKQALLVKLVTFRMSVVYREISLLVDVGADRELAVLSLY